MVQGEQLVDTVGQLDVWHVGQAQDRGRPAAQVGVGRSPKGWWALRRQGRVGREDGRCPTGSWAGAYGAAERCIALLAGRCCRLLFQEVYPGGRQGGRGLGRRGRRPTHHIPRQTRAARPPACGALAGGNLSLVLVRQSKDPAVGSG